MPSEALSLRSSDSARATPLLFTPIRIGPVELENRVVMAPMTTRCADADGFVTEDAIAYYGARAEGGVGLITVEMASPEKAGKHRRFELGIHDDKFIPGLRRLVSTLHGLGAKVAIQLGHGGGHTRADIAGVTPIAPSAIPHVVQEGTTETIVPEAMTRDRIRQTVQAFADAACRARKAGFDIVEVHGAHGYLISQFLAPAENLREDDYGGSLENRARFALEIIGAIKRAAPELGLVFRMNGDDYFEGGIEEDEAERVAIWAAQAGADAIHITGGHYRSKPSAAMMIPPMAMPEAMFLAFAARVKKKVGVPVVAVGRLGDPETAMRAVEEGKVDCVALGRPLLADAEWVRKARAGKPVRHCIACNTCVDGMRVGERLHCLVNPATGRETSIPNVEARQFPRVSGKRIAVIGAGPAGLTYAALVSAHNSVTIFERGHRSGGAFLLAGKAPKFQGVEAADASLIRYVNELERQCREKGATFVFGTRVGPSSPALKDYDLIVVATGAAYRWGIAGLVNAALHRNFFRLPGLRRLAQRDDLRDWFYYRARRGTGDAFARQAGGDARVRVIGDARSAGKSREAIASAFEAALAPGPGPSAPR